MSFTAHNGFRASGLQGFRAMGGILSLIRLEDLR